MRRRTLKICFIVLALVALTVSGAAYWIGFYIEQQAANIKEIRQVERGWFSSRISSSLNLPDKTVPAISLQHDIYHGPLPFISADTALDKNSIWCDNMLALCDGEHPFLTSKIELTGGSQHNFDVPRLEVDTVNGMLGIQQLNGELQIPLLADSPQGSLQTHLQNLIWTVNSNSKTLKLADLKLQSDLATEDAYLNASLALTANSIVYGKEQAGPGEIRLRADRIDYHLLSQLSIIWRQHGPSPDFLLKLQEFLGRKPRLILTPSHLETPYGDMELTGELLLDSVNFFKLLAQPLSLIDTAYLDIRIAQPLLDHILVNHQPGSLTLSSLVQNGSLTLLDGHYQTRIRIQKGQMYLNHTPWPWY